MREHWVVIDAHPRYMASSLGQVLDLKRNRIPTQTPDRAGYLRVKIHTSEGRKTVSVHRLVCDAFYAADISDYEVNHIDGDKSNNRIDNLELCDRSYNMRHAFDKGMANPIYAVKRVRIVETGEVFDSTGQVDRYLGVSLGSTSKTIRGLQPTCRGFTFELI